MNEISKVDKFSIDQINRLAGQSYLGVSTTLINAFVVSIAVWNVVPRSRVILWFSSALIICIIRTIFLLHTRKTPTTMENVIKRKAFLLTALFLSGCMWGSAGIILLPHSSIPHQVFITFVLGGMVAGSVGVFASLMAAFYFYSIPTILPIIIRFFLLNDNLHFALGLMMFVFWFIMLITAKRLNREFIAFIDLKYENLDLITNLEKEVKERKAAEKNLLTRNQQIENIVQERTEELQRVNKRLVKEIEEQKRLETQLQRAQKMEALGTMAGGVAHDLNNILSGIVSYPDLLLMEIPEDSPLRKPVITMQDSGKKAAAIVQDLLTLTRRGVVSEEVVNLRDIISDYLLSPEHEKLMSFHPKVRLEIDLEEDLLNILGSPIHLAKTIMNLVSNGAEAIPEGGKIEISVWNQYLDLPVKGYDDIKKGDYVILSVSDNGVGISKEDIDKIFEPFFTKKVMGRSGTGLGMAVVWGTVKDHNGYIDIISAEGQGTTFNLYFPVTRKARSIENRMKGLEDCYGNGESILVVDDVKEQREIASALLEQIGYSVTSVPSGEEAISYLKKNSIDLIVLDMIMDHGMDGLETYKSIIQVSPGQKAIITSGYSETDRVKETQRLGVGVYIKKPYTLEKLGRAVRTELDK